MKKIEQFLNISTNKQQKKTKYILHVLHKCKAQINK